MRRSWSARGGVSDTERTKRTRVTTAEAAQRRRRSDSQSEPLGTLGGVGSAAQPRLSRRRLFRQDPHLGTHTGYAPTASAGCNYAQHNGQPRTPARGVDGDPGAGPRCVSRPGVHSAKSDLPSWINRVAVPRFRSYIQAIHSLPPVIQAMRVPSAKSLRRSRDRRLRTIICERPEGTRVSAVVLAVRRGAFFCIP